MALAWAALQEVVPSALPFAVLLLPLLVGLAIACCATAATSAWSSWSHRPLEPSTRNSSWYPKASSCTSGSELTPNLPVHVYRYSRRSGTRSSSRSDKRHQQRET